MDVVNILPRCLPSLLVSGNTYFLCLYCTSANLLIVICEVPVLSITFRLDFIIVEEYLNFRSIRI